MEAEELIIAHISGAYSRSYVDNTSADDIEAPYVIVRLIRNSPIPQIDGYASNEFARVQVDIYEKTGLALPVTARDVRERILGIEDTRFLGEFNLHEPNIGMYRRVQEYTVQYAT